MPDAVTCGDYEFDDGRILICKYNGTDENVVVPDEADKGTNTPKPEDTTVNKNETSGNTSDSTSIIGLYTMITGVFGIYKFKKKQNNK